MVRILASILLAAALAGCAGGSASSTTTPRVTITQAQAEAAARATNPDVARLVAAKLGPIAGFAPNMNVGPGDRMVWAVTFTGSFPLSCGPAPPAGSTPGPCPPPATSETVLVDAETGMFIAGLIPAI